MTQPDGALDRDRLGRLFEQALLRPPHERTAFLDHECGADSALRDELASLLGVHDTTPDFLEHIGERVLAAALLSWADPVREGAVIGRYRVLERIGGGGMGVVYRAHDLSLERPVALKFLPAQLSSHPEARARLIAEARAASALDHPAIAVVHEIGSLDASSGDAPGDGLFIVMAFYDGDTLRQIIERGPLHIDTALDYAVQIADGLSRAHEAGIMHRDIKPENVMVTGRGRIRILDFGLASVALAPGAVAHAGTPAYMSPEQTTGSAVDHRSDIWSLGVLLYELLAGVRPFRGDAEEMLRAIRHDDPPALEALRAGVPPELGRLVRRCMAKDAGARYASAELLLADLRRVARMASGSADTQERQGIVVLPFADMSAEAGNEYFSDGLTEEVIASLSHVRGLRVISHTSAMRLKQSNLGTTEIARELDVAYVLEGGVRKSGDAVRITTRLIDARSDSNLWTRRFDGTLNDVFRIQEQVAHAVTDALRIRLTPEEERTLAERPIPDARAYESYLRARHEAWRFTRDGLESATRHIEIALAMVGDNALLQSTLGHITAMHLEAGIAADAASIERVAQIAERVFALDPDSARGHWLMAFVAFHRGDLHAALRSGERALALRPDDPDALLLLGYVYAHAGLNRSARELFERAQRIDPLTPLTQCMPGFVSVMEGRFGEAVAPYRQQYRMAPDNPFAAVTLGWVLAYCRQLDEALPLLDDAAARFDATPFADWARALAGALRGESDAAVRAITPRFEASALGSEMFARALAQCCALAGDNERAVDWLEHAVGLGLLNYRFIAEHDWFLDGIRHEPRFRALLRRVAAAAAELQATAALDAPATAVAPAGEHGS
jgi:eukaryotic-like serine/threonine-protein kinase